ncbi:MAG: poly-gamma-glutamate synthase PgsB [Candidatus Cloacimonetes bacterium]|nr:poly-gamma-glutamate synthase PgsB [Candidatus Cloacimonadota bacterium]
MIVLIIATAVLVLYWVFEYIRHQKDVREIPIRIHVNGTRGKSSVSRLIAAGLRGGGIPTVAKITGTLPRFIMPNGEEAAIVRLAGANILEQKYMFRYAAEMKPKAFVIECMAVNPVYQWITEKHFVKATHSVITNSRLDHTDLMGPTVESVTKCLCNTIPKNGYCFTAEEKMYYIMEDVAKKRNCEMHKIRPTDITPEEMSKFSYIEHAENAQLALAVCMSIGVSRQDALEGMWKAHPDPGALKKYTVREKGKEITFYNVFAANDPDSSSFIWNMIVKNLPADASKFLIINSRSDRYYRSQQLVDVFVNQNYDYMILTGEIPEKVESYALHHGVKKDKLITLGEPLPERIYEVIAERTKREAHVVGVGNIAGQRKYGASIVAHFRHKANNNK